MAEKKITKKMVVEMMLADEKIVANEVFKAYLENELELLKKKSENKKATKNKNNYSNNLLNILVNRFLHFYRPTYNI